MAQLTQKSRGRFQSAAAKNKVLSINLPDRLLARGTSYPSHNGNKKYSGEMTKYILNCVC